MSKPGKFTQKMLAELWDVTPGYVTKCKKEGCPVHDPDLATKWREENRERQVLRGKNPEGAEAAPPPEPPPLKEVPEEPDETVLDELTGLDMSGLERELKTARAMARSAGRRVKSAELNKQEALIGQRQQTYNKAVENYERMEKSVRAERQRRGELMTVDQHKIQLNRLWVPTVTLMRKMPRTLGIKVCPADDVHAEKLIATEVENVIVEVRRSLAVEPNPDFHLNLWFSYQLDAGNLDQALARLEEVRQMVLKAKQPVPNAG